MRSAVFLAFSFMADLWCFFRNISGSSLENRATSGAIIAEETEEDKKFVRWAQDQHLPSRGRRRYSMAAAVADTPYRREHAGNLGRDWA